MIYRDDNGNGAFDAGEPVVPAGHVEIYDTDETLLGQGTTDGLGNWSIDGLPAATQVRVQVKSPLPGGLIEGPVGADSEGFVRFTDTSACTDLTFGALLVSACSNLCIEVGNRVWFDEMADGLQNAHEVGIAGITVSLYDNADQLVAQTTTGIEGRYSFTCLDGLMPNTGYEIRLDNPDDRLAGGPLFETFLTADLQGTDPQINSKGTLSGAGFPVYGFTTGGPGEALHTVDFGFTPPATIGDTVWWDVNGNEVQDSYDLGYSNALADVQQLDFLAMLPPAQTGIAEPGIVGVTVSLYDGGTLVDTQVTDQWGKYRFRPVQPGISYRVEVDINTLPSPMVPSYDEDGAGDDSTIVAPLSAGQQHLTADFGYSGGVDLGVDKQADFPDWRLRPTIEWTVTVTNYGSIPAPNVVVADSMGGPLWPAGAAMGDLANPASVDVILGRIFELYWQFDPITGDYNPNPDVTSQADAEALIDSWITANVSVDGGADWSCTLDYNLSFPGELPINHVYSEAGQGHPVEMAWYYETLGMVIQDIQLYYLCELGTDLAPGMAAPPILFSISNEFNSINHEPDTIGIADDSLIGTWDQYPGQSMGTTETNYVVVESSFGAEPLGIHPNEDQATISGGGDLHWEKDLLHSSNPPFDLGEDQTWLVTVTNAGMTPWYDGFWFSDTISQGYIIDASKAPWRCDTIRFDYADATEKDRQINCFHPALANGLLPGDTITLLITTQVSSSPYGSADPYQNQVNALYASAEDDDPANNSDIAPYTVDSTDWTVTKGAPAIVDGEMEWTVNHNVTPAMVPAGQVFVIEEQLPVNMPLRSVEPNGWLCEPRIQGYPADCPTCATANYNLCWFEPVSGTVTIPALVLRTDYVDGAMNTACPGRGIRSGPQIWRFGANSGVCESSPIYSADPIDPTDMALTKSHDLNTEPWMIGSTGTFTLTITELNIGADRPVVEDVLGPGLTLLDVRNAGGQSVITASGDPITGTGWSCTTNIAPSDLQIFTPTSIGNYSVLIQCISDTALDNATDVLYVDVQVTGHEDGFARNDGAVEGLTKAEPKKSADNLPLWATGDAGRVDNFAQDVVPVPAPDLQIIKSHAAPLFAGTPFDFTILVSNNNDFSAIPAGDPVPVGAALPFPLYITDTFPVGLDYLGFSGTDWTCSSDSETPPVVSCIYGMAGQSLAAGDSAPPLMLQAAVIGTNIAEMSNSATVWSDQSSVIAYDQTPDSVTDLLTINIPLMVATKTASQSQAVVGDTLDFMLNIENSQAPASAPVRIVDTIPAEFNINNIDPGTDWDCSASAGQVVDCLYIPGDFPQNGNSTVTVNVTVDSAASAGQVENTMTASHGGIQADPSMLISMKTIDIMRYADLTISKARDIGTPNPGDIVAYTIAVNNAGPASAQDVQVLDYIPYGGFYVDNQGSDSAWSCSSDNGSPELVTCELAGDLPVGNAPALIIRMGLTADSFPAVSNFVSVKSSTDATPGFTGPTYAIDDYMAITGCIGDYVWLDTGSDGLEDGSDPGIDGVFDTLDDIFDLIGPGVDGVMGTPDDGTHGFDDVTLELLWAGPDDTFGNADDVNMGTAQTDATGYYAFEFLPAGYYTITVDTNTGMLAEDGSPLASYDPTYDNDSGTVNPDNKSGVQIGDAPALWIRNDIDFGYFASIPEIEISKTLDTPEPASIGAPVNFTIRITNTGNMVITELPLRDSYDTSYLSYNSISGSSPSTDDQIDDGQMDWRDLTLTEGDLAPGDVIVVVARFTANAETGALTAQNPCLNDGESCNVASVTDAMAGTEPVPAVEASDDVIVEKVVTGKSTLGDFVWYDTNSDGTKDSGEWGINNVIINLYEDLNFDTKIDAGEFVTTTTTFNNGISPEGISNDGYYQFPINDNSFYIVEVDPANFAPGGPLEGYVYTGENGTNIYNGAMPRIVPVGVGPVDIVDVDFSYVAHSLGNYVWLDSDNSGDVTAGELPVPDGVIMELLDSSGTLITDTVATGIVTANGYYLFTGLAAGDYQVRIAAANFQPGGLLEAYTHSTGAAQESDPNSDGDQNDNGLDGSNPVSDGITSAVVTIGSTEPMGETPTASATAGDDGMGTPDGNSNLTVDFGLNLRDVMIGDRVWIEDDNDGDGTTGMVTPVVGSMVTAVATNGTVYTDTTDSNGYYTITVPANMTYTVSVATPVGTTPTPFSGGDMITDTISGDDLSHDNSGTTVVMGMADNLTVDFGFYAPPPPVLIGDRVWLEDDNDGDATTGVITPVVGSMVTAIATDGTVYTDTTDAAGYYTITVPANMTYTVSVATPAGTAPTPLIGGDMITDTISGDDLSHDGNGTTVVVGTEDNLTVDFGFSEMPPQPSVLIGDRLWIEDDNDGDATTGVITPVVGSMVTAIATDGTVYTDTTDAAGYYTITVPANMTYTVSVATPAGTAPTPLSGGDMITDTISGDDLSHDGSGTTVVVGTEDNLTVDFGFYEMPPPPAPVHLGARVWIEDDNDGLLTTGVITPVVGSVVTAIATDGTVYTGTTDVNGYYTVTVPANMTYTVTIDTPPGTVPTPLTGGNTITDTMGGDDLSHDGSGTTVFVGTEDYMNVSFGFFDPAVPPVLLGDRVWIEDDNDGDATTGVITPVVGSLVTATTSDGLSYSDTTDSNGYYTITVLANMTYTVSIATPAGTVPTPLSGGNMVTDTVSGDDLSHDGSGTTVVMGTDDNLTVDFGFYEMSPVVVPPVIIGDRVWIEDDNDGLATTGVITPVVGSTVMAVAPDGTMYTDTTDSNGYYTITVPANMTYTVSVGTPAGTIPTPLTGGNMITDTVSGNDLSHDGSGTTVVVGTADNLTVDFGFYDTPPTTIETVLIGDRVWVEDDNDGDATTGVTNAVEGSLVAALADDGTVYTGTTDVNGYYTITVPANMTYTVSIGTPAGTVPTPLTGGNLVTDSSGDNLSHDGSGTTVVVGTEDNLTVDFGFYTPPPPALPVMIGDRVWIEDDNDGDATTGVVTPVVGSVVTAIATDGTVYTDTTDSNGYYTMTVPANMTYTVSMATPSGTVPTMMAGGNSATDPAVGDDLSHDSSGTTVVVGTADNLTVDFGFRDPGMAFALSKDLNTAGPVRLGEAVTFTIRITNTGTTILTTVPLTDTYSNAYMTFVTASPAPDSPDPGQVVWDDLTTNFGMDLNPGETFEVVVEFFVKIDTTGLPDESAVNIASSMGISDTAVIQAFAPTSVQLATRNVDYIDSSVILRWETADETDVAGFMVYRQVAGQNDEEPELITQKMVVAQKSGSLSGAAYMYADETAQADINYRYFIGVMDTSGLETKSLLGDIATVRTIDNWQIYLPIMEK